QVLDHPIKEMHVFDWMFEPELTLDTPARAQRQVTKLRTMLAKLDEPQNQHRSEHKRMKVEVARAKRQRRLDAREELLGIVSSTTREEALQRYVDYFAKRVGAEHR